jgi:hypothetical protein
LKHSFLVFLNIHYFLSQYFFDLEEIILENLNISENNIISVELGQGTKVFPGLFGGWTIIGDL